MTTSIPAGFHFVFPFHPFTHMPPRLIAGIVPSPFPNLTPDLTSGTAPLSVTAASIHCCLANGKSSGVLSVVALSHPFEGSLTSHFCQLVLEWRLTKAVSSTPSDRDSSCSYSPCIYQYDLSVSFPWPYKQ